LFNTLRIAKLTEVVGSFPRVLKRRLDHSQEYRKLEQWSKFMMRKLKLILSMEIFKDPVWLVCSLDLSTQGLIFQVVLHQLPSKVKP